MTLALCRTSARVTTPWSVLHVWTLSFLSFDFFLFDNSCSAHADLQMYSIRAREAGSLKNVVFPLRRPNADVQPLCQELASLSLSHQSQDSFTQPSILAQTLCVCVCVSSHLPHYSNSLMNDFRCVLPFFSAHLFSFTWSTAVFSIHTSILLLVL